MAKNRFKFYVVWVGHNPGIYKSWQECQQQIIGFADAKFKSFTDIGHATQAFQDKDYHKYFNQMRTFEFEAAEIIADSICVDAACSGNPGIMEYRGVDYQTREVLFHRGPYPNATNNIGEFLALVLAMNYLQKHNLEHKVIYSDSATAISWVMKKRVKTNLVTSADNQMIFDNIEKAEKLLQTKKFYSKIIKWDTKKWGEIPADFGRK
jgi:ribonuclease HI